MPWAASVPDMIPDRLMLERLIDRFAAALLRADSRRPVWTSRKGRVYQPGIGPHAEDAAMRLMLTELAADPLFAGVPAGQSIAYPGEGRQKCDLWIGDPPHWVLEVKMARFRGDNGKPDDTAIKDLLSPYPSDRSALTDTLKLATSGFTCRKAMMIYGFNYPDRPLEPAIHAFERLAAERVHLGCRVQAPIKELVHPVHNQGVVYAWEITSATR